MPPFLLLAAALNPLGLTGCSSHEAYTRATEPVSEAGTTVHLELAYQPRRTSGHSTRQERFILELQVARDGEEQRSQLHRFGVGTAPEELTSEAFRALHDAPIAARVAADGRAVAVTIDGTTFHPVLLEDPLPLYCPHVSVDPAGDWPTQRELSLSILASGDPSVPDNPRHHAAKAGYRFDTELDRAIRFVCARPEDTALSGALIQTLVRPDLPIFPDTVIGCANERAQNDPALRVPLLEALASGGEPQKKRAALALAHLPERGIEQALVERLGELTEPPCTEKIVECTKRRFTRLTPAWSHASVVNALGSLSAESLELGLRLADDADPPMQILGLRTLAMSEDPRALAKLEAAAEPPCAKPLAPDDLLFERVNEGVTARRPVSCWARALMAR